MTALNPSVRLIKSQGLPNPSKYVQMMNEDYAQFVINEIKAPTLLGAWRSSLGLEPNAVLDLEIGTGNGYFFTEYAHRNPTRNLLGMELKFKPLIQTIKRSVTKGNKNAWAVRYHAGVLTEIFKANELNNVFIYFPDPWPKKRHFKNRLITTQFLDVLFELQKTGSTVEIKTDHDGYFDWILEHKQDCKYKTLRESRDLHASEWAESNFQTHFEKLWTSKGIKTKYLLLEKP